MKDYFNDQIKRLEADRDYCVRALLAVSEATYINKDEILSSSRKDPISKARFMLYNLMSRHGFDDAETGRIIDRHASTISYGIEQHKELMHENDDYATKYTNALNKIR